MSNHDHVQAKGIEGASQDAPGIGSAGAAPASGLPAPPANMGLGSVQMSAAPVLSHWAEGGAVQAKSAKAPTADAQANRQAEIQDIAQQGLSGSGGALPHLDSIQQSFGHHDVSGVGAHVGGAAASASAQMGAQAYASGNDVAFKSSPDLHTAAHEAAHVVQQRAGVQLKGGVGQEGDSYERHADAVADAVVQGKSAQGLLDQQGGGASSAGAVQQKAVQLLGTPLDKPLAADAEKPAFGEDEGHQRRYSPEQYVSMWEKEQGHKMSAAERSTIDRGCIGLSAANLQGGGNPLDYAEACYGNFEQAHEKMAEKNKALDAGGGQGARYVMFAKLFWSNQSDDWDERLKPDENAFKPDAKTGEVDMTGYKYQPQSRMNGGQRSSYVNFDYGFWDEASSCFWHANHMQYKDAARRAQDPMKVLQSTREKFVKGYLDFDRIIFCVAKAEHYNPGLAAITHAGGGH